jgi:SAM-dependent methyltransferase
MPGPSRAPSQHTASLKAHWESVGQRYTREWDPPGRARIGEREIELILAGLRASPGRTALDVGIGSGRILSELLRQTEDTVFYGIDIAEAMVEATRARLAGEPRLRDLQVCDIAVEPVPFDETFDSISAIRMLKYNVNWREIVGRLAARLDDGGVIVFSMTNRDSLNRFSREDTLRWETATKGELEELCNELGLTVLALTGFTKLPHVLYNRARSPRVAKLLLAADAGLAHIVGPPTLAREIFVSARRG